ncbi:hypothetical protein FALBO_10575 [Fusarium albosuccineum]|uniref:Reverse transcriptase n=1 Tax=Fusarium albosuccineum TaxID=1237068 RepID=A0A8H4P4Y1_9HYPO|nr:hypothetical protein FALBO_10575 [Fusarium albosuccineum]
MHFSRSKLRGAPAVRRGDVEKRSESTLRWLGIWLDSRLSFRVHVEKWADKAQAVTYRLRGLTNTKHGPLPSAVRSAAKGMSRAGTAPRPTRDVSSSNQHLEQRMKKAFNRAMRAILPVWKTTPITILHREGEIPPVDQLLEARRLKSLDETQPLTRRTALPRQPAYHDLIKRRCQAQAERSFRTRLRHTDELLIPCARPKLIQRCFKKERMPPLQTASKGKTAEAFLR